MTPILQFFSQNSSIIFTSITVLGCLGLFFGATLAIAAKILHVKVDEKISKIDEILPQANCGACGYPGCAGYAEAIVNEDADISLCAPGGTEITEKIAQIMGKDASQAVPLIAKVQCQGGNNLVGRIFDYNGIIDCNAAALYQQGDKTCPYGCLGYGSCVKVCPFDAIHMGDDGIPIVDEDKCVGCGKCVEICPRQIIKLTSKKKRVHMGCLSQDKGKDVRKYCAVGCIGCTKCIKVCPTENAIRMEGPLAVINHEYCTSCAKCFEVCPTQAIVKILKNQKRVPKAKQAEQEKQPAA
jgi:RnfABCDGE-type electron transport complex B subunit